MCSHSFGALLLAGVKERDSWELELYVFEPLFDSLFLYLPFRWDWDFIRANLVASKTLPQHCQRVQLGSRSVGRKETPLS